MCDIFLERFVENSGMEYGPSFDPMDEIRVALNDRQLVCVFSLWLI